MPDSWLGNFPGLANVGFLFVVSADENVELFRRIIRQLRAHGFTAIGFRHVEEAVSAIKSRKRFLRGMTAFGMVPDEASVDAVVQWFSEERAIGSGLRPAVALPFPEDGLAVARPEQVDSLLPCSINFASALDLSSRCERIVRTLSFDIQNYPLVIGQMDSESRRKMRAKSDQLLPLIPSHMPFSELGISITLFLRLCAEGGPRMPEFGTLSALIRSVPALASVDPELLSLLSQDPDSVWALKKALDRTEYRYRGTTA